MADLNWHLWETRAPDTAKVALDAALEALAAGEETPELQWARRAHRYGQPPLVLLALQTEVFWRIAAEKRGSIPLYSPFAPQVPLSYVDRWGTWWVDPRAWASGASSLVTARRLLATLSALQGIGLRMPEEDEYSPRVAMSRVWRGTGEACPDPLETLPRLHWIDGFPIPAVTWAGPAGLERIVRLDSERSLSLFPVVRQPGTRSVADTAILVPVFRPEDARVHYPHTCHPMNGYEPLAALIQTALRTDVPYAEQAVYTFRVLGTLDEVAGRPPVVPLGRLQPCAACWHDAQLSYDRAYFGEEVTRAQWSLPPPSSGDSP